METLITALERKLTHEEVFLRKLEVFAEKSEGGGDLCWSAGDNLRHAWCLMRGLNELRKVLHSDASKNAGADLRLKGDEDDGPSSRRTDHFCQGEQL